MHPKDVQIARLSRNLHNLASNAAKLSQNSFDSVSRESRERAENSRVKPPKSRKKGRAAVVAWDLSHNPAGRAYVLYKLLEADYNVDLVGPIWTRYGHDLWSPLQDADLNLRAFRCADIDEFVPKAGLLAAAVKYDLVYVCKPRLPSVYLATLIKLSSDCPMIIDVDDFELSFFKDESTATLADITANAESALAEPFEELGTRYCQSLISEFDAVTVSNIALRKKFGGHIVRHARDEEQFSMDAETRALARERLGIKDDEFALIFIGTPRPHKGVFEVARALHELKDDSIVFHIVGDIADARVRARFDDYPDARVIFHGDCAFSDLPVLLSAADLVPLIQNPDHAISQFQIPAKISDATALGIPVIATATPPVRDIALQGGIETVELPELAAKISEIRQRGAGASTHIRTFFTNELGLRVNRARLRNAIDQATAAVRPLSAGMGAGLSDGLATMVELIDSTYRRRRVYKLNQSELLSQSPVAVAAETGDIADVVSLPAVDVASKPAPRDGSRRGSAAPLIKSWADRAIDIIPSALTGRKRRYDIVFFWKQNDSGIYGRRSDMVLRYLSRSDRVGKILQFDAPMTMHDIDQDFRFPLAARNGQSDRVLYNLYDRQIRARDTDKLRYRSFLASKQDAPGQVAGNAIRKRARYPDYVRRQMDEAGMRPSRTIAWFCPVIWDAPSLIESIGFQSVVTDLIDDQRGWNSSPEFRQRLERNYTDTLNASDLVFANCEPLASAFQHCAPPINIVPNGAERFVDLPEREVPEAIRGLPGPIIGYVGNLRDRIDWMLLTDVVQAMPEASFVFAGPASDTPNARQIAEYPNVHMVGVVPYEELLGYLRAFDVGIVPHLRNQLTERMNPLKMYNYFAAGLPIVSSDVNNIEELGGYLEVATSGDQFVAALQRAVAREVDTQSDSWRQIMDNIAWDNRIDTIIQMMDESLRPQLLKSA